MTKDYEIFQANKKDTSKLVFAIFTKYKALIEHQAKKYSFHSGGRIDKEDFISDVYEKLYYYANYIKEDKINPENFMFHLYVKNSIISVLKKSKKVSTREFLLIDDEGGDNIFQAPDTSTSINTLNINSFMAKLTPRQKTILSKVQAGKVYKEIQKEIGGSYGIIPIEMRKIKAIAKDFF